MSVRMPDRIEEEKEKRRKMMIQLDKDFSRRVSGFVREQVEIYNSHDWKIPRPLSELLHMVEFREKNMEQLRRLDGKRIIGTGSMMSLKAYAGKVYSDEAEKEDVQRGQMKIGDWDGVEQSG